MRTSLGAVLLSLGLLGASSLVAAPARAENILITNQGNLWRLGSAPGVSPLNVNVKKGDVIEFKLATLGHGVVTLDKPGNQNPSAALQLVLACGEDPTTKPNHVLKELDCVVRSRFNAQLIASVKFEVTDKFSADVPFWCVVHLEDMWGTFKLAP